MTPVPFVALEMTLRLIAGSVLLLSFGCDNSTEPDASASHRYVAFDASERGDKVVFSSTQGDLYLLHLTTGTVDQLTVTVGIEAAPAFSPDEKTIVYSYWPSDSEGAIIRSLHLDTKETSDLTDAANHCDIDPRFSLDGTQVAFSRGHRRRAYSMGGIVWDDWDACIMDTDGGNVHRITNQFHKQLSSPCFGPASASVIFSAFIKRQDGSLLRTVFQTPLDQKGTLSELTTVDSQNQKCAARGADPDTSSDGKTMVYISDQQKRYNYDVYVMNLAAKVGKPLNLTSVSKYNASPCLTSEAKVVFFLAQEKLTSTSQPVFGLWKVNADGTNPSQVAGPDFFDQPLKDRKNHEQQRGRESLSEK